MTAGRDIACVGVSDWANELQTNDQHLLRPMAPGNRIHSVESLGLRRPQVSSRDIRRIGRRLVRGLRPPRAVDGLHVSSPLVLPYHGTSAIVHDAVPQRELLRVCDVQCSAERAREARLDDWAVSLTHEGDLASAVVIATTTHSTRRTP